MSKLYSFDLFDTLVTRRVKHPHDVFLCIESTGKVVYRSFLYKVIPFSKLRIFCEKICRKFQKKEDINIHQIYSLISFFIKNSEDILKLEISIEYKVLYPIVENVKLLNSYLVKGERVCITSDMYLSKEYILEILRINDIRVNDVYVSSEIGLTKGTGSLFRYIANDQGVKFEDIIHYGDNLVSDYLIPQKLGIKAVHVESVINVKSNNIFNVFKVNEETNPLFKVGYCFCGPVAFSFSYFINKNNYDKRNIVFGARDSYIFEKAFNTFFNDYELINTSYTRVSRSLVYMPSIFFTKNMGYIFEGSLKCNEFFERLGLNCPNKFDGLMVWSVKRDLEKYLIHEIQFFESLRESSECILEYLEENGFDSNALFVDIGWRGSIQDSLKVILKDVDIRGFYVGTINSNENKKGFIFQNKKPLTSYFHIMQCISYFEFIFTEPERSISNVKYSDDSFDYIFTADETQEQISLRRNFKNGAWAFFDELKILNIEINEKYLLKSVKKLIKANTMSIDEDIIIALNECSHSAGFNGSLQSSLLDFNDFSTMSYLRSPWKAYFMHKLRDRSLVKYYIFIILYHNPISFILYENFKIIFRKLRAKING